MSQQIDLNLFLNHLKNAVVIATPEGTILFKNAAFDLLFCRGILASLSDQLHEIMKLNPMVLEQINRVKDEKGTYSLRAHAMICSDGSEKILDIETFPLFGGEGDLVAISLLFIDRSGDRNFEEHQKRADRIHYLATIASGLAHEIKNPLSGIKGASQLLTSELKNKKDLREYAQIIQKEVTRVDRLLKDLLHFTKPRKLKKKKVNINRVLHDIIQLQATINPKKITFVEEYDLSLSTIRADSEALSQIFLNLIKNARQAIPKKGQVKIRSHVLTDLVLKKGTKKRKVIGVDIIDTGKGIDPEALKKIFVPFFTTKAKGSGLGLALCYQLVEEHEGNIQVKSEKGKGSTFSVYLPV